MFDLFEGTATPTGPRYEALLIRDQIQAEIKTPITYAKPNARSKSSTPDGNLFTGGLTPLFSY